MGSRVLRIPFLVVALLAVASCGDKQEQRNETMVGEPAVPTDPNATPHYLFTFFRGNGMSGLHLAHSTDGYNWKAVNNDQPLLQTSGRVIRDSCPALGPDGFYHLVWTTGDATAIGYGKTRDFITYEDVRLLPVMASEPTTYNCWAPELLYLENEGVWMIHWSSTIPGRFPEQKDKRDHNHRIYYTTTRDFKTFEPTKLLFDPGHNVIDTTIHYIDGRWLMIYKDETLKPFKKHLRLAWSDSPFGPWGDKSDPFTPGFSEGPSVLRVDPVWMVYYDDYKRDTYHALMTQDFRTFQDVSGRMTFPNDHSHGSPVRVPADVAMKLLSYSGPAQLTK